MAVAYVNKQETMSSGPVTSMTAVLPTGWTTGNYFVMVGLVWARTASTPAGWTQVLDGSGTFSGGAGKYYVWIKKAGASESNPAIVPVGGTAYVHAVIEEYSGVDATTPLDGTASYGTTDADTSVNTPGITTAAANSMLLYFYADVESSSNVVTPPSGATSRHNGYNATLGNRLATSEKLQAAAGTVAATNYGRTLATSTAIAATMALRQQAAAAPVADFTGTPLTGTWPLSVVFTDASTNTPTSWAWTFGDGGTSSSQNPSHSYAAAGTYTVVLVATNAGGSDTKTRTAYVTVSNPSGTFTKVVFGDHLKVTDLGGGVIRVDYV